MKESTTSESDDSTQAALDALARGYTAIPIRTKDKKPHGGAWEQTLWAPGDEAKVTETFAKAQAEGSSNVGLVLGSASGGLVDVDLDHPMAARLRKMLPPTAMRTGRVGRPQSHYWYRATTNLPEGTRRYKMPDGGVSVELRSTGGQTVIPPSVHPSGESYRWEGEPWGGEGGPAEIDGVVLAVTVAMLALNAVLLENWPKQGSRHEAYLALAGALLRFEDGVHPWWERNLQAVIVPLAEATHDDTSGQSRLSEVLPTTVRRLRAGEKVTGWPSLAEVIGNRQVEQAQRLVRDVEGLNGGEARPVTPKIKAKSAVIEVGGADVRRDPMRERVNSWEAVDLEPYLYGEVEAEPHSFLVREDGLGLIYDGKRNTLVGPSEQGKTWAALIMSAQRMDRGDRVVFIDLEDSAKAFVKRLRLLGVSTDDIAGNFAYLRPDDPIAGMQRDRWSGALKSSDLGSVSAAALNSVLDQYDPSLIVVDGTTTLYQMHGLSTNDNVDTDVVGMWLETLTNSGRRTITQIDHTGHGGSETSLPIGSQHKKATVTGALINVTADLGYLVKGRRNLLTLSVLKDKPGEIRGECVGTNPMIAAEIILDSTDPSRISWEVRVPDAKVVRFDLSLAGLSPEVEAKNARKEEARLAKIADFRERILVGYGGEDGLEIKNLNYFQRVLGLPKGQKLGVVDARLAEAAREELVDSGDLLFTPHPSNSGASWTFQADPEPRA